MVAIPDLVAKSANHLMNRLSLTQAHNLDDWRPRGGASYRGNGHEKSVCEKKTFLSFSFFLFTTQNAVSEQLYYEGRYVHEHHARTVLQGWTRASGMMAIDPLVLSEAKNVGGDGRFRSLESE
jgi:hypothetical protein